MPTHIDLLSLIAPANDQEHDFLEAFIGKRLADAGFWASPRRSDGIETCRVVQHSPVRVALCGNLWDVSEQTLHTFWLQIERAEPSACDLRWALFFDVVASPRLARSAAEITEDSGDIAWRVTLSGEAAVQGDALVVRSLRVEDADSHDV